MTGINPVYGYQPQLNFKGEQTEQKSSGGVSVPLLLGTTALGAGGGYMLKNQVSLSDLTGDEFKRTIPDPKKLASEEETKAAEEVEKYFNKSSSSTETTKTEGKAKGPKSEQKAEKELKKIFGEVKEGKPEKELSYSEYLRRAGYDSSKIDEFKKEIEKAEKALNAKKNKDPGSAVQKMKDAKKKLDKAGKLSEAHQSLIDAKSELIEAQEAMAKKTKKGKRVTPEDLAEERRLKAQEAELKTKLSELRIKAGITPADIIKVETKINDKIAKAQKKADISGQLAKKEAKWTEKAVAEAQDKAYKAAIAAGKTPDEAQKAMEAAEKQLLDTTTAEGKKLATEIAAKKAKLQTKLEDEIAKQISTEQGKKFYDKHLDKVQKAHDKAAKKMSKEDARIERMKSELEILQNAKREGKKITRSTVAELFKTEQKTIASSAGIPESVTRAFEKLSSHFPKKVSGAKVAIGAAIGLVGGYIVSKMFGGSKEG